MKKKIKKKNKKAASTRKPAKKTVKRQKYQLRFPKPDKRVFILISYLLFITSAVFLVLKKDLASEEIIKYAFFSLIAYLLLTANENIREKN